MRDKGRLDEAIAEFHKAIELDPKNAMRWSNRGYYYSKLHQYDTIALDPKDAMRWSNRGAAYNNLHQYDKALADLIRVIELDPKNATAWNDRGWAYLYLHQYDKALADLNKAIELEPKNATTWSNRGWAYQELHQYDKAIADHTKAIELDPKDGRFWNGRGWAYNELHQYDKALSDYSKAIELDPKVAVFWSNRGAAYEGMGQAERAVADYSTAIALDPKLAAARIKRGSAYNDLQQYDKAVADLNKLLELEPQNVQGFLLRGWAFAGLEQWDKASADFSKCVELNSELAPPWHYRALVYLQRGDRGGFRKACAAMREHFRRSARPDAVHLTVWTCIQVPDALEDWTPLTHWAEKTLTADPNNFDRLTVLGALLYRAGRFEEAARRLREADAAFRQANRPTMTIASTWLFLALAHERLGHPDEARQWLAKAVREIDQSQAEPAKDPSARMWNQRLSLGLFRREAEALIGRGDKRSPHQEAKDTPKKP
jgi:tetratricopeptide (TPR) repeat protein